MNNPNPDFSCTHALYIGELACAHMCAVCRIAPTGSRPPSAHLRRSPAPTDTIACALGKSTENRRESFRCLKLAALAAFAAKHVELTNSAKMPKSAMTELVSALKYSSCSNSPPWPVWRGARDSLFLHEDAFRIRSEIFIYTLCFFGPVRPGFEPATSAATKC
jgi:hypothetical protein